MGQQKFLMPKMGESITEATILSWSKQVGDRIEEDETLLEIATDKVDSELPSPYSGILLKILHPEGATVPINQPIAIIETTQPQDQMAADLPQHRGSGARYESKGAGDDTSPPITTKDSSIHQGIERAARPSHVNRFYSPLVRTIAEQEQISIQELNEIRGTGEGDRVTKADLLKYLHRRSLPVDTLRVQYTEPRPEKVTGRSYSGEIEIIEMDRMRKLIADHMVRSKHTAPHVTSFLEIDISNVVNWRQHVKEQFFETYGEKITYTPIFIEAVGRALLDFPDINVSVDGHRIIKKKYYNLGMATATASGNLIVPIIRNVDQLSLLELTQSVNDLGDRARNGRLKPEETQDGTFTLTNVGTFGNTLGTPIINQPQVAILSVGAIRKKPAVIETPIGDTIGIRHFMFLSLSYDHRVVDGSLGGQFLRRVGDYLEGFDEEREI